MILTIIIQSCKDDKIEKVELGFFPLGEAKDYIYFKKGTWWVYKNDRTGLFDTIEVYFNLLDTLEQTSQRWHFTNELFSVKSKSLTYGHRYNFYQRSMGAEVNEVVWACMPTLERNNPYEGELNPFYFPFSFITKIPGTQNDFLCTTVKDTMSINGKIYSDVAIFYLARDVIEPSPLTGNAAKYYWAKNHGLVRKDLFDSKFRGDTSALYHSWKIIDSHIIQ